MNFKTVYKGNMSVIIQINANVFCRIGNLPVRDQCNTGIVLGKHEIILIDLPEQNPDEEILKEVETYFHKKVTHIILTHAHGDHRNGLISVHRKDITLVTDIACKKEIESCFPDFCPESWKVVSTGDHLNIDGITFRFWVPKRLPAHSPWDMCITLPLENIAFTGDFVVPPNYLYAHSSNWKKWRKELSVFHQQNRNALLVMGHGYPCRQNQIVPVIEEYLLKLGKLSETFRFSQLNNFDEITNHELFPDLKKSVDITDMQTVQRQLKEIQQMSELSKKSVSS